MTTNFNLKIIFKIINLKIMNKILRMNNLANRMMKMEILMNNLMKMIINKTDNLNPNNFYRFSMKQEMMMTIILKSKRMPSKRIMAKEGQQKRRRK